MRSTGIVAEYNPFHNGHLHHLLETKKRLQFPIIAVISSSFMQRGEPAILSKWQRARLGISGGVDLVLELPVIYSLSSAEYFARGAAAVLQATGCTHVLSCGCEDPELDFPKLAKTIKGANFQKHLKEHLGSGLSYAAAHSVLLENGAFSKPNNILALEYTKALVDTNIEVCFIQRSDGGYNSPLLTGNTASASAIRRDLAAGGTDWKAAVPPMTAAMLQKGTAATDDLLWQLINYRLRCLSEADIARRTTVSEGMEYLLKQAALCSSLSEAVAHCTNKRYPSGRIRRLFLQLLLDAPRSALLYKDPAYIRVLAFNDNGRRLLKKMKSTASLPLITKLGKNPAVGRGAAFAEQLALELRATDVWALLHGLPPLLDYRNSPVYIKNDV